MGNKPNFLMLEYRFVLDTASNKLEWKAFASSHGFIDLFIDRCGGRHSERFV
jgi:hypothetical protein